MLGEHIARITLAKWNGDGQGEAAVAAVAAPGLPPGKGSWSSRPARGLRPHDVDVSRLHHLAHQPARMQDLMCSNVEHNFGTSLSSGDACHVLRWGIESDYAGAPYDVIIGANVVSLPYDLVVLARRFHTLSGPRTRVYVLGKARLAGPHIAFKGEIVRLFARVPRVAGPRSWIRSLGVFISCHMDGKIAVRSRWVMVVATMGERNNQLGQT